MHWPFLKSCVDEGLLEPIDLLFAQRILAQAECTQENVGAFLALMMASYREGHVCFEISNGSNQESALEVKLCELASLGQNQIPDKICQVVSGDELPLKPICRHGNNFYFQKSWVFETQFLQHYLRLSTAAIIVTLRAGSPSQDPALNPEQQKAIQLAMESPISLIIGGPGTGKTFTAKHLVKAFLDRLSSEQRKKFQVILTAPTGKAVTHLEKQIASVLEEGDRQILRSGTLHALLQMKEDGSQKAGVALLADLIIVDECSMIDAKMSALLFAAIPSGTHLVLIGDKDQLPAVETGCFFADLIDAGSPSVLLKQSRRVENGALAELSHAIREGEIAKVQQKLLPLLMAEQDVLQPNLYNRVQSAYPSFFSTQPKPEELLAKTDQFRILSCLRQGPLGVDAINGALLQAFYAQLPSEGWWAIPIMITRNDYTSQLYNGDTGILVKKIDSANKKIRMGKEDYALFIGREPIAGLALPAFEYAYCLSVHKSQGSEYDAVMLLVPEGSEHFGKEILYTAVTRARKDLIVYAQPEIVEKMMQKSSKKRSGLSQRLQKRSQNRDNIGN